AAGHALRDRPSAERAVDGAGLRAVRRVANRLDGGGCDAGARARPPAQRGTPSAQRIAGAGRAPVRRSHDAASLVRRAVASGSSDERERDRLLRAVPVATTGVATGGPLAGHSSRRRVRRTQPAIAQEPHFKEQAVEITEVRIKLMEDTQER